MPGIFSIIVVDRNPYVRELLRRELTAEGYLVKAAKEGHQIFKTINFAESFDLLILDLDMPYDNGLLLLEWIQHSRPALPVIIHTFHTEYKDNAIVQKAAAFVEKTGDNIDILKDVVMLVLKQFYAHRFTRQPNKADAGI